MPKTCDLTLIEHWNDIADVLTHAGIGLRCEKAYHAFLIIAETSRILNNHPVYDPKPEAEKLAAVAIEYAKKLQLERAKAESEATFALSDALPIDKNKVN
jgi:hypothetical protein